MALGMDDLQTEVVFEGVEVAVVVEEGVAFGDAEGGDNAVDGLADGNAACAEETVVVGRGYSQSLHRLRARYIVA